MLVLVLGARSTYIHTCMYMYMQMQNANAIICNEIVLGFDGQFAGAGEFHLAGDE